MSTRPVMQLCLLEQGHFICLLMVQVRDMRPSHMSTRMDKNYFFNTYKLIKFKQTSDISTKGLII